MKLLVATPREVLIADVERGTMESAVGLGDVRPTCLTADPQSQERAWCGTRGGGVFRSDDGGRSWRPAGLAKERLMSLAASPGQQGLVWAGTEPSAVWRSDDGGSHWERTAALETLPSSEGWAFPPKPETHHVRWIACHPMEPERLWVAIEAGALITTDDGGSSWRDRVEGGPYDTHELSVHSRAPGTLRVAAGDGYFESFDGGVTWERPRAGLEVGYLRSVAIDPGRPEVVVVSAASGPRSAYVTGRSDGRLYRRVGMGRWERVVEGWPDPPSSVAPLIAAGRSAGELWAADERGVHRSEDGGVQWRKVTAFGRPPDHLRGLVALGDPRADRDMPPPRASDEE